jgi:superfamily II DNA/RNA helicase
MDDTMDDTTKGIGTNAGFTGLAVPAGLITKLEERRIRVPTAVQYRVIPPIFAGHHVIFQSETGTGKTLAYLLPVLHSLTETAIQPVRVVIAAPTHELASQIKQEIQKLSDCGAALCIGSAPIKRQIELLKSKPAFVVGNPRRITELVNLGKLKPDAVQVLVLDEADRLFSPEQSADTAALMSRLPRDVQVVACSATIGPKTQALIAKHLAHTRPLDVLRLPPEDVLQRRIEHQALFSESRDKVDTLRKYLAAVNPPKTLVFIARARQTNDIVSRLRVKGIDCGELQADMDKLARKQAIDRFRSGKTHLLVTSDLAARGLDIPAITHIVQLDLPQEETFFIHRAGRTARAGASGINMVIGDQWELEHYAALEKNLGITVYPKMLYGGKLLKAE